MECPTCSTLSRKFGRTAHGTQRYRCDACCKTFAPQTEPLGMMRLPMEKAVMVLKLLLEGCSVRSAERLSGVTKRAILALMVHVGENCRRMLDDRLQGICVNDVEADEIWSFVGCKERTRVTRKYDAQGRGDSYTFIGIEASTKLVVAWHLGKRSPEDTQVFSEKLNRATSGRFQLTTDGFPAYTVAIPRTLGDRVDYSQLVKVYGKEGVEEQRRYSPPIVIDIKWDLIMGQPQQARACTSYVERGNLSIRTSVRRFTRLTLAHSKKWSNHEASLALWFAFYNYCRRHMTLKETPAMASGLEDHQWTIRELIEESAKH